MQSFWDDVAWTVLYRPGHSLAKARGLVKGFWRRATALFRLHRYDFVFIHREASPIGPPVLEWLIAKAFRKKIIYDFDDAIWLPNTSAANRVAKWLKWHRKVGSVCRWSHRVSCGNAYLADYARAFNPSVIINPTTIDTEQLHNRVEASNDRLVVGWTGTHSTLQYLEPLIPILLNLERSFDFEFWVISNQAPKLPLRGFRFLPWRRTSEVADLSHFDIGVMPLADDAWGRGKCGFKALQYMALGISAVISPVGVNAEIVEDGLDGFLCRTPDEWEKTITQLLNNEALRVRAGKAARQKVVRRYSVQSNTENFLRLFTE